jgi:hypothetical protein
MINMQIKNALMMSCLKKPFQTNPGKVRADKAIPEKVLLNRESERESQLPRERAIPFPI